MSDPAGRPRPFISAERRSEILSKLAAAAETISPAITAEEIAALVNEAVQQRGATGVIGAVSAAKPHLDRKPIDQPPKLPDQSTAKQNKDSMDAKISKEQKEQQDAKNSKDFPDKSNKDNKDTPDKSSKDSKESKDTADSKYYKDGGDQAKVDYDKGGDGKGPTTTKDKDGGGPKDTFEFGGGGFSDAPPAVTDQGQPSGEHESTKPTSLLEHPPVI